MVSRLVEPIRLNSLTDVGAEIFPRIGLGEDVFSQRLGDIPAIGLLRNVENDFPFHSIQFTRPPYLDKQF